MRNDAVRRPPVARAGFRHLVRCNLHGKYFANLTKSADSGAFGFPRTPPLRRIRRKGVRTRFQRVPRSPVPRKNDACAELRRRLFSQRQNFSRETENRLRNFHKKIGTTTDSFDFLKHRVRHIRFAFRKYRQRSLSLLVLSERCLSAVLRTGMRTIRHAKQPAKKKEPDFRNRGLFLIARCGTPSFRSNSRPGQRGGSRTCRRALGGCAPQSPRLHGRGSR